MELRKDSNDTMTNKKKLLIAVSNVPNCGKTQTLQALQSYIDNRLNAKGEHNAFTLLTGKLNYDFCGYFTIGKYLVGISSGGDTANIVQESLTSLHGDNCDIIITACRTRGGTITVLSDFYKANASDFDYYRFSKEFVHESVPKPANHLHTPMKEHAISIINELIEQYYPGLI